MDTTPTRVRGEATATVGSGPGSGRDRGPRPRRAEADGRRATGSRDAEPAGRRRRGGLRRVATAIGLSVVLFALAAVGVSRHAADRPPVTAPDTSSALAGPAVDGDALGRTIAALQARIRREPADARALASLGLAYVQEARITADPSYYPKAEGALRRSLDAQPAGNLDAEVGMGALALARHDFADGLAWGRRARATNPYHANARGVIGDALVELGRYPEAFAAFQDMVDLRPDVASYARVSYARELQGDVPHAVAAMRLAFGAAGDEADQAWASTQLGELFWNSGRVSKAEGQYRRAAALDPSFMPAAAGLAKVAWARGGLDAAIARYSEVVNRYPAPEHVIALGDLYAAAGDDVRAARQYGLVRAEERLFRASGVNTDLELALFDADHGDPEAGLAAARAEWARRHSIHVADALAWALYRNGRIDEAAVYARRALRLGTRNALFLFHAGMIEKALGHRGAARDRLAEALATNPSFSILWADDAARALDSLGGPR